MSKSIRNSAKALVIRDGKMLVLRLRDADGEFYIMPGGGQRGDELLTDAVCREVAEETGLRVECRELLFVIEGMTGEDFHRVDLVFACDVLGELPDGLRQTDTNQIGVEWLDIAALNRQPLYPSRLRRQIMNYYAGKPYRAYLGCENMGDPEEIN